MEKRTLVAKDVKIKIDNEPVSIDIYVNEDGHLVLAGIGSVIHDMLEEELWFNRPDDYQRDLDDEEVGDGPFYYEP